jgi:hypothetical protein
VNGPTCRASMVFKGMNVLTMRASVLYVLLLRLP